MDNTALLLITSFQKPKPSTIGTPLSRVGTALLENAIRDNQGDRQDIFFAGDYKHQLTLEKIECKLKEIKESGYKNITVILNTHGSKKDENYSVPHECLLYSEIMKLIDSSELSFQQRGVISMACHGERIFSSSISPNINFVATFSPPDMKACVQFDKVFEKSLESLDPWSLVQSFLSETICRSKVPYTIRFNGTTFDTRDFIDLVNADEYHKKALKFFEKEIPSLQELKVLESFEKEMSSLQESIEIPQQSPQGICCNLVRRCIGKWAIS